MSGHFIVLCSLALASLAILLLDSRVCPAQETRGSITGRVTDATESIVPGARVEALNMGTGTVASSLTNQAGSYDVPYLLPGSYRLTVQASGFKKSVRERIEIRVNDRLNLNFALEVGDVADSVQITAESPLLETATASVGKVMGQRQVTELPVVGGNAFYLSRLSAGVLSAEGRGNGQNPFDTGSSTTTIIVNGTRSGSSEVTLDGAPNMYNNTTAYAPPQDLVQEFKIHTAAYDASQGHAAGAVVNVSLKSGTNQMHGTGYYFDSRLRGRPWFLNRFLYDPRTGPITERKIQEATPGWLHLRWGATLTGPVFLPKVYDGRNRTFWSFGYEGVKVRRETTFTGTVPTAEQRRGDFSGLLRLGTQYQIYDPFTTVAAANGRFSRTPLAGNLIPASRVNAVGAKLISFYPEPNSPGTADGRQNYFRIADDGRLWGSFLGRIDHNFSQRHRAFLRLNSSSWNQTVLQLPSAASGNRNRRPGYGIVLDDVYVFNPRLFLNVRYGFTYQNPSNVRASQGFDLLSLGLPQRLLSEIGRKSTPAGIAFPQTVIDGGAFTDLGDTGGDFSTFLYHTLSSAVTRVTGNHSLRFGGDVRVLRENAYNFGNVAPRLEFAGVYTRGPLDNSPAAPIGQGLASMLLGIPSGGRGDINASRAQQSTFTALYFQNDWKLSTRLTVNAGLRWEFEGPTTERFDRSIRGFDAATANPVDPLARANYALNPIPEVAVSAFRAIGGLTFPGAGRSRGLWSADRNNFAPRIGLAYQWSPKLVIRAGYGIFYDLLGVDRQDVNQGGFNQSANIIPTLDNGLTYRATLSNPLPDGLEVPPGSSGGLRTFLGRGISFFHERPLNPCMQRWSLTLQRELPGHTVVGASYVGNRGTKLLVSRQFSPIPEQYLSTSPVRDQRVIDFLSAQVNNPFFGLEEFAGTGLAAQRIARNQLLRAYPHFTGVSTNLPNGFSYYHSFQVEMEKRMSRGLMFLTSWTYSKFMEARTYQNETDPVPEKVISDQDYPHRLVVSAIYEFPFGRGKPIFGNAGRLLNGALGGWQLQGWFEGQTGQALGFGNAIFRGNLKDIPLPVSARTAERWFNAEAGFERSASLQLANNIVRFPSRFSGVRGDGINNWDFSLFKSFHLREGWRLQFRMETYNSLNHVQFANPNTAPANTAFGTVTAEKGHGQRQVTFALKLLF